MMVSLVNQSTTSYRIKFGYAFLFSKNNREPILFIKIINGLAEVAFECILMAAYKDTIIKQNNTLR